MAPPIPASKVSSAPMSPPSRLHLRNILPSSPEEPPIMPPPPRTPRAWVWQCHNCHSVYKLACTRRCLECSHIYCVSNPNSSSKSTRGKKRRRKTGLCAAEFDYVGWEQWGQWRRKVLGYEATGRCETEARDHAFLSKSHDCSIDCDSPSECCHRRFELAAETLREKEAAVKSTYRQPNPEDDISITEVLHESRKNDDAEETPPKSPPGRTFLWDENDEEKETELIEGKWRAVWSSSTPDSEREAGTFRYPPGVGDSDWSCLVDNHDYYSDSEESDNPIDRPVKRLSARNLTRHDVEQADCESDSESGSESDGSSWSPNSSESDDSSTETGTGK
ncbi:hypothetical protein GQX73_g2068 [Xylaria multiplex]|uniref:Uncharacterized protein n=1 Tax=Xylaria multiplex TaxID=323545 RepID=A0A7C8ISX2_9PEZI|nr:hypothetical protein GQX73_g2068 [Xylaria multiplex]